MAGDGDLVRGLFRKLGADRVERFLGYAVPGAEETFVGLQEKSALTLHTLTLSQVSSWLLT